MNREIGEIWCCGVLPPPSGNIEPGGQAISRTKYVQLFRVYGEKFGVGDGSTTFNVPDLRGRVQAGPNSMGGDTAPRLTSARPGGVSGAAIGNTGGEESHLLSVQDGETPADGQVIPATTGNQTIGAGTAYSDSVSLNDAGTAHNNVQPTIVLGFAIYTGVYD